MSIALPPSTPPGAFEPLVQILHHQGGVHLSFADIARLPRSPQLQLTSKQAMVGPPPGTPISRARQVTSATTAHSAPAPGVGQRLFGQASSTLLDVQRLAAPQFSPQGGTLP